MIASGALTLTMVFAAVAPQAALRSTFGEGLDGRWPTLSRTRGQSEAGRYDFLQRGRQHGSTVAPPAGDGVTSYSPAATSGTFARLP